MISEKHIKQFAIFYLICFLANQAWSLYHGLTFSQLKPIFFLNKLDLTGNIIMLTNIQHTLIESWNFRLAFDLTYLLLPFMLVYSCIKNSRSQTIFAVCITVFNIVYNYYFSMMSFVSIEVLVGWMLVPLIFIARTPRNFYFALHTLRILFIVFFFSAALWKIRAGGIFNIDQMSGILVKQHAYILVNDNNWFTRIVQYLINNNKISYSLYFLAFLFEFLFIAGLFTRKFDRQLILLFCLFAFFNYFLMEINYFTWLPFMGCLYFSKLKIEEKKAISTG